MKEYLRAVYGLVEKLAAGSLLIGMYQDIDLAFHLGWALVAYCAIIKIWEVHCD